MADTHTITFDVRIKEIIKPSSLQLLLTSKVASFPFLTRIKENAWVECNDDGNNYIEVQVNCSFSNFLQQPKLELLRKFFLMIIQRFLEPLLTKVLDAGSSDAFVRSWATIYKGDPTCLFPPDFTRALSLFSLFDQLPLQVVKVTDPNCKCAMRRFVFHSSKIAEIKAKAASESVKHPSGVEGVTALIWKYAVAASRSNSGSSKPSSIYQPVNLRRKIVLENAMGNHLWLMVCTYWRWRDSIIRLGQST
ncbi:hypothetical protein SLEP1_g11172 [Rubroshorea leprosula]|uniref:Uncharacterized protein n=1 Tax=Rubroshorea leprosula TaxID=152421 RepID=A0AAV5IG92_9ROSI|nr:hypothetical protein SLEP1_g11172 [Rubroshorea leprosula]